MGFRINTNIAAMSAHQQGVMNNNMLNSSLEKLSSGLRINKSADDASGMAIADSLRNQSNSLGQAIRNANDAIGIVQIADKAMDEQVKILDTIKTKATQAAQDGQTSSTRSALQQDISRLLEELDNIAVTTNYNGKSLLSGAYSNKEFQIGAYSNTTIKASIGATSSDKIGNTRFETSNIISTSSEVSMKFIAVDGVRDITIESVTISTSTGTGIGVLADAINKNSEALNVKASWQNVVTGNLRVASGGASNVTALTINGITIGNIQDVKSNDSEGILVASINKFKDQTGVEASIDSEGRLNLRSIDGRGIVVSGTGVQSTMGIS
jgi:flagellin